MTTDGHKAKGQEHEKRKDRRDEIVRLDIFAKCK